LDRKPEQQKAGNQEYGKEDAGHSGGARGVFSALG